MRYVLEGLFGPFVAKEMLQLSRRVRTYVIRVLVGLLILAALMLVWMTPHSGFLSTRHLTLHELAELSFQSVSTVGVVLFVAMAVFPFVLLHDAFSREHELGTLELLQMTDLTDGQIISGKFFSVLLTGTLILLLSAPIFIACQLMGGVDTMLIIQILFISELMLIASSAGAVYASVHYLHSRLERTMIWLLSFYGFAAILVIGVTAINTICIILFKSPQVLLSIYLVGTAVVILQSNFLLRSSRVQLPIGASQVLKDSEKEWLDKNPQKQIKIFDIETKPLLKVALFHRWSDANLLWLLIAILGLFMSDPVRDIEDVPRVILNIGCRFWVVLTPLLCIHPFQRKRPGVWDDLLLAPLSNRALLAKYLYFGVPSFLALWVAPILFTIVALPMTSLTLADQTLVFISLGIWGAVTSWLSGIPTQGNRLATWGPTAFFFFVLIAYPMLVSHRSPHSNALSFFNLYVVAIAFVTCFVWATLRPTTLTVILFSTIALLFLTILFGTLLDLNDEIVRVFRPVSVQTGHSVGQWSYALSILRPILAAALTCGLLICFVAQKFDQLTERVEQKPKR